MNLIHPELLDVLAPEVFKPEPKPVYVPSWVTCSPTRYEEWREGGWGRETYPFWER